jgi:hypothetical protein
VLTINGISPSPAPGTPPSGTFTFMSTSDSGPDYQYDVKASNYPKGTYTLSYSVSGDPVAHTVNFVIN